MKNTTYTMITGATGGLGRAFVVECAKQQRNLFLSDIHEDKLAQLAQSIRRSHGIDVQYKALDFLDEASFSDYWNAIEDMGIQFDMLINVAGLDYEGSFFENNTQDLMNIIRVNSLSVIGMVKNIVQYRNKNQPLNVINVSSLAGFYPMPLKATYSASKRLITHLSIALNHEIKAYNGNILSLCPAGMATFDEVINSIQSQGFMGRVTTLDTGYIVHRTIDKVKKGHRVYIPGIVNKVLHFVGKMIPDNIVAGLIYKRWIKTREIAQAQ